MHERGSYTSPRNNRELTAPGVRGLLRIIQIIRIIRTGDRAWSSLEGDRTPLAEGLHWDGGCQRENRPGLLSRRLFAGLSETRFIEQ